ncbi:MAG: DNA translocase FtsK 4TM domain-containing protein [Rhodospirillaceae bacterium]|jgi:DNA segregation ATPase FtsK/SpoIIIE-like protein|nr:DNA translocase FtsK 4TM domain-containing protein [Rhodospirillaceae bacterium]
MTKQDIKRFIPVSFINILKQIFLRICGIITITVALAITVALVTYSRFDSSLNTATSLTKPIYNMMGMTGAILSDLLLQLFGLMAWLPIFVLIVWGRRLLSGKPIKKILLRILLLICGLLLIVIGLSTISLPIEWHLPEMICGSNNTIGGLTGKLLLNSLNEILKLLDSSFLFLPVVSFCAVFGIVCIFYTLDISINEWLTIKKFIQTFISKLKPVRSKKQLILSKNQSVHREQLVYHKQSENSYELPQLKFLTNSSDNQSIEINEDILAKIARQLESVLEDFGVNGQIVKIHPGPVVTLYELEPVPGTKTSRVISLANDISRSMSVLSVRIATVPGRSVIGIELPNSRRETVFLHTLLASKAFENSSSSLTLALGKDIGGQPIMVDLASMPHLLIAGTTGSGKSVAINTMILSLLYRLRPEECRMIMIDPKMLELSVYDGIPHLLAPVVTEPNRAVSAFKWAVREMEDRYRAMSQLGVRNITGYNQRLIKAHNKGETLSRTVQIGFDSDTGKPIYEKQVLDLKHLPFIVVIVDEMADLMLVAGRDIEVAVQRLAQMARAAGIHVIMATQRPSVDVITGTIKANFPSRISFQVSSRIDSRTILGEQGAEQLLGHGDMLYMMAGGQITRVHGPFVSDQEVELVADHLRKQGNPQYLESVTEVEDKHSDEIDSNNNSVDSLYDQAVALIIRENKASTSFIQRHLQIGYNRAARIIEKMESEGIISRANHVGKREILIRDSNE